MPYLTVNGTRLFYESKGEGEPILFLHGMGASWRMWEPQWDIFSKKFKMIMIDLRGHGQSGQDFPGDNFSFEVMAHDLKDFLDGLKIEKVHVVGVSMGAVVGQIFAYTYPHYVHKLILADGWCEIPDKTTKWVLALTIFLAKLLPVSFINKATYSLYKGDEEDQVYTRQIMQKSIRFTKDTFIKMKQAPFPDMKPYLHRITAPTLIAYGDRVSYGIDEKKGALTMFHEIPNAVLAAFHKAFDPVTVMRKDAFNALAMSFLEDAPLPELDGVSITLKTEKKLEVV